MKIHKLKGYIQNIFIAEYSDKLLLLDGCSRPDVNIIENFITKELSRPMSDLKLIVVSHMHPDHAGAAPILRKKYNIPIAAHHTADYWYTGFIGILKNKISTFLAHFVAKKRNRKYKKLKYKRFIKANFKLSHKNKLPFFNDWIVIFTPGHTAHDISLFHSDTKTIYTADLFLRIKRKCQLPFPTVFPKLMYESVMKVAEYNPKNILPAHGNSCEELQNKENFKLLAEQAFKAPKKKFKTASFFVRFLKKNYKKEIATNN